MKQKEKRLIALGSRCNEDTNDGLNNSGDKGRRDGNEDEGEDAWVEDNREARTQTKKTMQTTMTMKRERKAGGKKKGGVGVGIMMAAKLLRILRRRTTFYFFVEWMNVKKNSR